MENNTEKNQGNEVVIVTMNKNNHKKIIIGTMISICTFIAIYFGMVAYFRHHFYFGSEINCANVSGKTVKEVNKQMASEIKSYKLILKERDGKSEQISAEDIQLKYNSDGKFKKLKDKQSAYKWVSAFLNRGDNKMTAEVSYDKKLLEGRLDNLSCFDSKNVIEPKNPSFKYSDKGYEIVDEVKGNKVNKNVLYEKVVKAILKEETTIDLQAANCYATPEYTSKSNEIIEVRNTLNKYAASKITYTFGDNEKTIDGSSINEWLTVNENLNIIVDEEKVKKYMNAFANNNSTVGKTRSFLTSSGRTINIGGGDYGWQINAAKETQNLIEAIKEGKTIKKEPTYIQTAASHSNNDIGNTYVEIDMGKQHLWFYKNGSLIVEGNVVTGNLSSGHSTPEGIYRLKYKERNATLKGEGYSSFVNFWMPFNGGIGMHDASWRDIFGGAIYTTDGSHGCVNEPYNLAKTIFDNINEGTPVICYN